MRGEVGVTETQLIETIGFVLCFLAWSVGIALACLLSAAVYDWKVDRKERKRLQKIRREMNRRVG
jgi:hypothetical protein